jgi:hypothetical protein
LEGGGQIATELASRAAFASLDETGENTAKVGGGYLSGWPGSQGGESVLDVPAKNVAGIARGWLTPSLEVADVGREQRLQAVLVAARGCQRCFRFDLALGFERCLLRGGALGDLLVVVASQITVTGQIHRAVLVCQVSRLL